MEWFFVRNQLQHFWYEYFVVLFVRQMSDKTDQRFFNILVGRWVCSGNSRATSLGLLYHKIHKKSIQTTFCPRLFAFYLYPCIQELLPKTKCAQILLSKKSLSEVSSPEIRESFLTPPYFLRLEITAVRIYWSDQLMKFLRVEKCKKGFQYWVLKKTSTATIIIHKNCNHEKHLLKVNLPEDSLSLFLEKFLLNCLNYVGNRSSHKWEWYSVTRNLLFPLD